MGNAAHSTEIITPLPDQPADFTLDFKRRAANFLPIPPRCHLCFTREMEGLFINSSLIPSARSHQIWPGVPSWELQSPKTCPGSPRGEALWVETFLFLAPNHPAGVGLQQSHQGVRQGKAKQSQPFQPAQTGLCLFSFLLIAPAARIPSLAAGMVLDPALSLPFPPAGLFPKLAGWKTGLAPTFPVPGTRALHNPPKAPLSPVGCHLRWQRRPRPFPLAQHRRVPLGKLGLEQKMMFENKGTWQGWVGCAG